MKKIILSITSALLLAACASTPPKYNPQQFTTDNYKPTLANAIEYADSFVDFDQEKIPQASLDGSDFSLLLKADIAYNQGGYAAAADSYYYLAKKYNDPRLIYKSIICFEHGSNSPEQYSKLNEMIHALIVTAPNSQVGKIFAIKGALESDNLEEAKSNLNTVIRAHPEKTRAVLLLVTTIISENINPSAKASLSEFGDYVAHKYDDYPEAHLLALVANSLSTDSEGILSNSDYIQQTYPTWEVPTYWMAGILLKNENYVLLDNVMTHIVNNHNKASSGIQNLYIATLLVNHQLSQAHNYIESQLISTPSDVNLLTDSAIINYKLGNYPHSIMELTQVESNGYNLNGSVNLALAALYDISNKNESAVKQYQQAQSINPIFTPVSNLGILRIYVQQKNFTAADSFIDAMNASTKTNAHDELLIKLAIYTELGAYDHAYEVINQKIKLYAQDKQFVYYYASLLALTGRTEPAIKWYRKYIKMNPNDPTGYNDLAFLLADKTTSYAEANKLALKAYQAAPNDPAILDTIGWANYKIGNYAQAENYIGQAYRQTHDHDTAMHLRQVYLAEGKKAEANKMIIITPQVQSLQDEHTILNQVMQILMYYQFGMDINK